MFEFIKNLFCSNSQVQISGDNSTQIQIGSNSYQKQVSAIGEVEVYSKDNKTYITKNGKTKAVDETGEVKIVNGRVYINGKEIDI